MKSKTGLKLDDLNRIFEQLAESSRNVYWLSSPDLNGISYISSSYEEIWGRPRELLYQNLNNWQTYLHPEDAGKHHPIYLIADRIQKDEKKARFSEQYRIIRPDGETRWILDQGFALYDAKGIFAGVIGVATDTTNDKKYEWALEANKAKSAFITNISHDIRGPIANNIGLSKLLEAEIDIDKIREYSSLIRETDEQLLGLLNDILDLKANEDSHEKKIKFEQFSLIKQLENLKKLLTTHAIAKNIDVRVDIDPLFPQYIVTDRVKIYRILLNIVNNAIKFTQQGYVKIQVDILKKQGQFHVVFIITDTGIGIPKDKLAAIFEHHFRMPSSQSNKYSGYGIGLSIVKQYVDLLKGTITVTSTLGGGSQFKVVIPIQLGREKETKKMLSVNAISAENNSTQSQTETPVSNNTLQRVLIIEDDTIAQHIVVSAFKKISVKVEEANSAEMGFSRILENRYDLIVTDVTLPGMNGNQLTTLIRAWEKTTSQPNVLPIVGLTAHGKTNYVKSMENNFDLLLEKPIDDKKIHQIMERLFSTSKSEILVNEIAYVDQKTSGLGKDLPETEVQLFQLEVFELFDEAKGAEIINDMKIFKELLEILIQEIPKEMILLKEAYESRNWESIQFIAHKLKGSALYCGAVRMRYACQYIERYLLAGHTHMAEPLYQQLLQVLNDTVKVIKVWLGRTKQ